jgi:Mg2+-importing ATPase
MSTKNTCKKPRKWDASSLGRFMLWMGPTSSIFDWLTYAGDVLHVICPLFSGGNWGSDTCNKVQFIALFQTGWFIESLWSQSLVIHMIRTNKIPLFQSRASWQLNLATFLVLTLATALPFIPGVSTSLGFVAMPWPYFLFLLSAILLYMLLATFAKDLYRRRYQEVL